MLISIAIPCYRSEKNLEAVVNEIRDEFSKHPEDDYQIILVCDGSPDHTDEVIRRICAQDEKITGVLLSRNYTQPNAKMAAIPHVRGEVLVFMDDDGQHPADGIFPLADMIVKGYDVAYASFPQKKQSRLKALSSRMNEKMLERLGTRPKGIRISSFVAYSRFVVERLKEYKSPSPSFGGFVNTITTKYTNVDIQQRKRLSGKSGYSVRKLINLAITSYTNFTVVPLRIIDIIGFVSAFIGMIYSIVIVVRKLVFRNIALGYTSNMAALLILGGLILIALGLVGEYVGRIYMLLSNKPQYTVRETINEYEETKGNES